MHNYEGRQVLKNLKLKTKMGDFYEEELILYSLILGCALNVNFLENNKRKRKYWVKPWLQKRNSKGIYSSLVQELALTDAEDYRRYMRMNTESFQVIIHVYFCLVLQCNVFSMKV